VEKANTGVYITEPKSTTMNNKLARQMGHIT
jgi:hypothetical protein